MNIQLAEEYRNAEKGGNGAWAFGQSEPGLERGRTLGAGARERKDTWSRGSRGVGAGGPNSEDGVGAGAREKRDAVRKMSMKRRRD